MRTHTIALAQENQLQLRQAMTLALITLSVYILLISPAVAASPMGNVLCAVVGIIYGNLGRGLATLAIIIVGVGATLGKVSWGLAITVAVGISIIFNASTIANTIGVGKPAGCP